MPGVSGDPDSPHRLDQLDDWRAGRLRALSAPGVRPDGTTETIRP
jgi:acyl-homoserine lactone acylase PvdQ